MPTRTDGLGGWTAINGLSLYETNRFYRLTTAACSYPVTNEEIWTTWTGTNSATASNTYAADVTWDGWVLTSAATSLRIRSMEGLAAGGATERERTLAREEQNRQRTEANDRAMDLLRSCLNQEQRDQLDALGRFSVTAPSGRLYWIEQGYAGNIYSEGWCYCIHMPSTLPYGDHMLAQKLMIETDEEGFLRTANASLSTRRLAA